MNIVKRQILAGAGVGLTVITVLFTGTYFKLHNEVNAIAEDAIWDNIYVEDIDASGMKADDIRVTLEEKVAEYREEKITLQLNEKQVEITFGDLGFRAKNLEEIVEEAVSYGKTGSVWERYQKLKALEEEQLCLDIVYEIQPGRARESLLQMEDQLEVMPIDATISRKNGQFVVTEEASGVSMDVEASLDELERHFTEEWEYQGPEWLELVANELEATVTSQELWKVKDVLGTYTTDFQSGNARAKNIANATARIDGSVLMPGEELSASEAMGARTKENGYLAAGSYLAGEVVDSIGGGVCQVSTTLYNAVLEAELEVTERYAHSMTVSYVPASKDAAIAEGFKDLKFKNNTDTPIYIEGYVEKGSVTFTIYGLEMRDADREVKYVSETTSSTSKSAVYKEDEHMEIGIKKISTGHKGKKAILWKVVYEDGEEISREKVNSSTYAMAPDKYAVGTKSSNKEASKLVRKAISSQSRSKIEAAIIEAKEMLEEE